MGRLTPGVGPDLPRGALIVANSWFSAHMLRLWAPQVDIEVVHPVFYARESASLPCWEAREDAFLSISRIAPEKRIEQIIEILHRVRRSGQEVSLYLCGAIGKGPYGEYVRELCRQHASWVRPWGAVVGAKKAQVLGKCKFGISANPTEAFGISVAEMIKAGQIVFAPFGGGQVEILEHEALLYSCAEDAVEKILRVLGSPELQLRLRAHLARQALEFDPMEVRKKYTELVSRFLP